jgi:hypothetical protein
MKALAALVFGFLVIGRCDDSGERTMSPCLKDRIEQIKAEDVWNPAATLWRITTTTNKTYYYIPPHCCDFFGELMTKIAIFSAHQTEASQATAPAIALSMK